jgi:hypothetical protein
MQQRFLTNKCWVLSEVPHAQMPKKNEASGVRIPEASANVPSKNV